MQRINNTVNFNKGYWVLQDHWIIWESTSFFSLLILLAQLSGCFQTAHSGLGTSAGETTWTEETGRVAESQTWLKWPSKAWQTLNTFQGDGKQVHKTVLITISSSLRHGMHMCYHLCEADHRFCICLIYATNLEALFCDASDISMLQKAPPLFYLLMWLSFFLQTL